MNKDRSRKIQSSGDKNPGGATKQSGFDRRAQSAADRHEHEEQEQDDDR
ncbi:hypothetical protein ABT352_38760 [Streptosporangium sp. NPDC000563]